MDELLIIDNLSQFNKLRGYETLHPLANVVDLSTSKPLQNARVFMDTYSVALKEGVCGELKYGNNYYDYKEATMVFMAPGQVVGINNDPDHFHPKGWGLFFHPDLIHGTSLGRNIKEYTFFAYSSSEALHVSEREKQIIIHLKKQFILQLTSLIRGISMLKSAKNH